MQSGGADDGRDAVRSSRSSGKPSVALLVILGTALGFAETFLPRPIPFLKPGFANASGVIAAVMLGFQGTVRVNAARALAVALATGMVATPAFVLSLAGAMASSIAMGAAGRLVPGTISVIALSILGSAANITAQMAAASLMIPGLPVYGLMPLAAAWAVGTGALVGCVSVGLLRSGLLLRAGPGLVQNPGSG
jgi:heptaprenyl diphosphate synthase